MPGIKTPRRGSLAYYPRKRARRIYPKLRVIPSSEKAKISGYAAYKAGMSRAILVDSRKGSPSFGQEITVPVTILDCPPLKVLGIRAYYSTPYGKKVFTEVWTKNLPKELARKIKAKKVAQENLGKIEENLQKVSDVRFIVSSDPRSSGFGKKTPEVFELPFAGNDLKEKFEFAKQFFGKEIKVSDFLKEGELVDVISVTKGKGTAGPVKRFHVKIQNRHAKKKLRHVGALGSQVPRRVKWTVPMAGQLGFQTRTEMNKRVLKIGEKGAEVNPSSGFKRYGNIGGNYLVLEGSVPGTKKRFVLIRPTMRLKSSRIFVPEVKEIFK